MADELDLGLEEEMALEQTAQERTPVKGATCTAHGNCPRRARRVAHGGPGDAAHGGPSEVAHGGPGEVTHRGPGKEESEK